MVRSSRRDATSLVRRTDVGRSPVRRLLRLLRRRRRLVAVVLLCGAAGLVVDGLTPAAAVTVPVVVAARDLPAGTVLAEDDLRSTEVDPSVVPDGAARRVGDFTGSRVGAPLRRGSPLTDASVLGPGLLSGAPPGLAAVSVHVADAATLQVLRAGDRVDVVTAGGEGSSARATVAAHGATVLWTSVTVDGEGSGSAPWRSTEGTDPALAVVAVPRAAAAALAGATGASTTVSLVLVTAED